jgi:hypothetical protein
MKSTAAASPTLARAIASISGAPSTAVILRAIPSRSRVQLPAPTRQFKNFLKAAQAAQRIPGPGDLLADLYIGLIA